MPVDEGPVEQAVYDGPPASPFDSETVQPTSSAAPSSDPGLSSTSGTDGEQAPQGKPGSETEPDPLPEFDPRYREPFQGLMYVGSLTDQFTWLGHEIIIRTLTTAELAEASLLTAPYAGTAMDTKVWQAVTVAGCVISVDGQALPAPLTTDPNDTPLANQFRYVMRSWMPPTLDVIYERYYRLELLVREVIEAMGNRSG